MGSRGTAAVRWPDIAGAMTPSAGQPAMHSRARERASPAGRRRQSRAARGTMTCGAASLLNAP
jgi:hypothetical protein